MFTMFTTFRTLILLVLAGGIVLEHTYDDQFPFTALALFVGLYGLGDYAWDQYSTLKATRQ